MIDFYTAQTPNGRKVALMLEELGLPYKQHDINIKDNEQKKPDFIAMNPNGRIPVIVDQNGPFGKKATVFESGAILYYLAEKNGGKFLGHNLDDKTHVMQWVMFQMSAVGPMFGNLSYGKNYMSPKTPAFIERFEKESKRVIGVLEIQLNKTDYLAGNHYTIADMCTYTWVAAFLERSPELFADAPAVRRWAKTISERPAVKKIMV